MILKYADSRGLPPEKLLRGTGASLPHLYEGTVWTSQEIVARLLENIASLAGDMDEPRRAGAHVASLSEDEVLELIIAVSGGPSELYRNLPRWLALNLRTADVTITREEEAAASYRLTSRVSSGTHWALGRWIEGLLAAAAVPFGRGEASVTATAGGKETGRVITFDVRWDTAPAGGGKPGAPPPAPKETGLLLRRLMRRLEKGEARRVDLDRMQFLLMEAEEKFRTFFDSILETIVIVDEGGLIHEANRTALATLGYSREDLVGTPAAKLVTPQEEEMVVGLLGLARRGEKIPVMEMEVISATGRRVPVQVSVSPIVWEEISGPYKVLLMLKDLTSLRASQDEARRLRDLNGLIVDTMQEGIFLEDADGNCRLANPRMEEMLGVRRGGLTGVHYSKVVAPERIAAAARESERRRMGVKSSYPTLLLKKDGTKLAVKVSALPLFEEGSFTGVLSVVTELPSDEKQ